ncbi:hypothetical protein BGZ57DRAFT_542517 [Hyaloscypha finlandica]|nr:hypothetical protein BGZ57DRAFT_542517 [Hyaloscypha finlandica]
MKLLFSFSFLPFFHFIYLHSSSREQTSKRLVYLSTQQYSRVMIRYHLAERTTGRSCTTPKPHPLRDPCLGTAPRSTDRPSVTLFDVRGRPERNELRFLGFVVRDSFTQTSVFSNCDRVLRGHQRFDLML